MMIPATAAAGILTYIWPFVTTKGGLSAVGLVYGYVPPAPPCLQPTFVLTRPLSRISSGVFVGILAAPIVEMGETHDVGLRMGMYFTIIAIGALAGPPISGAINEATNGYKAVGYYAGTSYILTHFVGGALADLDGILNRHDGPAVCRALGSQPTFDSEAAVGQGVNNLLAPSSSGL